MKKLILAIIAGTVLFGGCATSRTPNLGHYKGQSPATNVATQKHSGEQIYTKYDYAGQKAVFFATPVSFDLYGGSYSVEGWAYPYLVWGELSYCFRIKVAFYGIRRRVCAQDSNNDNLFDIIRVQASYEAHDIEPVPYTTVLKNRHQTGINYELIFSRVEEGALYIIYRNYQGNDLRDVVQQELKYKLNANGAPTIVMIKDAKLKIWAKNDNTIIYIVI